MPPETSAPSRPIHGSSKNNKSKNHIAELFERLTEEFRKQINKVFSKLNEDMAK